MKSRRWLPAALSILLVVITSLVVVIRWHDQQGFVDSDQVHRAEEQAATLEPGHQIGQTFVARHGGLDGVEVSLAPAANAQGTIVLHLRESPVDARDMFTSSIPLPAESQAGFYRFPFPPILSSHSKYRYAFLEYQGTGQIGIPRGELESYPYGALYYDHEPQESQMVFRLVYDPAFIVLDLVTMVATWIAYGLTGLAILFFSGYWLVRRWVRNAGLDFTPTLILSVAAALAAWMGLLAWASLFFTLSRATVWGIMLASILLGLVQFTRDRECWRKKGYWLGDSPYSTLAFWLVITLSITLRLFVGRGLVMLPGGDSYHHSLIAQLFVEQGGIPRSYRPYAPLMSYSYHFGFHSIVALFRWLLGTEILATTKTVALVLNGAVAATVGLAAERWAGNRRAGVIAAAIVGLVAVSPFVLLRWGRFTQTTGLLFLAASLLALMAKREDSGWALPSFLIAGLAFSHYRIVILLALFVIAAVGMSVLQGRWKEVRDWLVLGIIVILVAAPWLVRVAWVQYDPDGLRVTAMALEGVNDLERLEAPVLSFVTNRLLLISLVLSTGVIGFRRETSNHGRLVLIWLLLCAGGAWAFSFAEIPAFLDLITTLLSLSLPIGILAGISAELLWNRFHGQTQLLVRSGITAALVAGIAVGTYHLPRMMPEEPHRYLLPADLVVMDWIAQNVGPGALFLVNSIEMTWSPGWVVGVDSGYWIPLLAHRATTVPPMIYPLEWGDPVELNAILQASREYLSRNTAGTPPLTEILDRYGITHVFVDSRYQLSMPAELSEEEGLQPIYHQDEIWVFEVSR